MLFTHPSWHDDNLLPHNCYSLLHFSFIQQHNDGVYPVLWHFTLHPCYINICIIHSTTTFLIYFCCYIINVRYLSTSKLLLLLSHPHLPSLPTLPHIWYIISNMHCFTYPSPFIFFMVIEISSTSVCFLIHDTCFLPLHIIPSIFLFHVCALSL